MNFILRMMIFIVFSVYLIIAGEIETTYYGLGKLTGVKYSPDGKYIATYGSKGICLVNPESMTPGRLIARGIGEITQIDFSPDGQQIALLKKDKSAAVVDILNDNVRILTGSAKQTKIQWSTAGDIIVASSSDTTIRLWDANNLTLLNEIKIDTTINDFSINPEGDIIGVTQRGDILNIIDIPSGIIRQKIKTDSSGYNVLWLPDKAKILTIGYHADIWDALNGKLLEHKKEAIIPYHCIEYNIDSTKLFLGSLFNGYIYIYNISSDSISETDFQYYTTLTTEAAISRNPNGKDIAFNPYDRSGIVILYLDEKQYPEFQFFEYYLGYNNNHYGYCFPGKNGNLINQIDMRGANSLFVSNADNDSIITKFYFHTFGDGSGGFIGISPDNIIAAVTYEGYELDLYLIETGKRVGGLHSMSGIRLPGGICWKKDNRGYAVTGYYGDNINSKRCVFLVPILDSGNYNILDISPRYMSWSPDGSKLLIVDDSNNAHIYKIDEKTYLPDFNTKNKLFEYSWNGDGKYIIGFHYGEINFWDCETGGLYRTFAVDSANVTAWDYSINGDTIFAGYNDGYIKFWDTRNGQLLNMFKAHNSAVTLLSLSPDRKILAERDADSNFRFTTVNDGKLAGTVRDYDYSARGFSWSEDSRKLFASLNDGGGIVFKFRNVVSAEEIINQDISGLTINPCPAEDKVNICFYQKESGNTRMKIYNIIGSKIMERETGFLDAGNQNFDINIDDFEPGIYFVTIESNSTLIRGVIPVVNK